VRRRLLTCPYDISPEIVALAYRLEVSRQGYIAFAPKLAIS
jgi:hypothetical protein